MARVERISPSMSLLHSFMAPAVSTEIVIGKKRKGLLLETLERDTSFLASINVIDYSLIVGIHQKDDDWKREENVDCWEENRIFEFDHGGMSFVDVAEEDMIETNDSLEPSWSDGDGKMEQLRNCIFWTGLIDILQPYNARKRAESFLKGLQTDKDKISSVEPNAYAKRFMNFMEKATC